MSKQAIEQLIQATLEKLQQSGDLPAVAVIPSFQVEATKDKQYGDYACNIAMILAKPMQRNPRDLAALIVNAFPVNAAIAKIEIAGPGFINFFLSEEAFYSIIPEILQQADQYGHSHKGQGKSILIEYVSANPTGPLHVGHGRHAAYGAVVADLLAAIGYEVYREYYVNDAGRQMDILAASTYLRYLSLPIFGQDIPFPVNAYRGEYVIDIAKELLLKVGDSMRVNTAELLKNLPKDETTGGDKEIYIDAIVQRIRLLLGEDRYKTVFDLALHTILSDIENDLSEFGVNYQNWFSERDFIKKDVVDNNIATLKAGEFLYEKEGALWFRSTDFKDEKDRVMVRSNGQRTYFANDFSYHINKFERGFDTCIDIFGADHHGYIPRMQAGLEARGISPDQLTYLLVQFVTLYRGGQQVQMSTRSGSFVTLRELRLEVGNDAARFFYIMRKCEQHVDFDLDLAKAKSNENPVYYIQYAHARICSVLRQLEEKSIAFKPERRFKALSLLKEPQELQLISTLSRYPTVIMNAAELHEPHILTNYLRELATDFHGYYNSHQFLVEDENLRHARITLIFATRQVLVNGLRLIGVSAPDSM